jgi:excinuclease ABC subunit C
MDLHAKIRTLPTSPGVYLYKNAEDVVIYVGKAKNLRSSETVTEAAGR